MVGGADVITTVSRHLRRIVALRPLAVVLDPVMVAKSGDALLTDDAMAPCGPSFCPWPPS